MSLDFDPHFLIHDLGRPIEEVRGKRVVYCLPLVAQGTDQWITTAGRGVLHGWEHPEGIEVLIEDAGLQIRLCEAWARRMEWVALKNRFLLVLVGEDRTGVCHWAHEVEMGQRTETARPTPEAEREALKRVQELLEEEGMS